MSSFLPPSGYSRIKTVNSFEALVSTPLANGVNALCWARELGGDFDEVVAALGALEDITTLDEMDLKTLRQRLGEAGRAAVDILIEDQRLLHAHGLIPSLDCIPVYPRDTGAAVPTDVYSFHADRAPVATDTYLCSYNGVATEGLRNDEARRHIDIPETRAGLLKNFGQADDAGFAEYLRENCYDLHYAAAPDAQPFSFGLGNLWRIAVEYPGSPVPPCLHRAPETAEGQMARLLLIS